MKENKRELKVHEADETASAAFRSERREDRERLTITMKEKEGRGSNKSVVLRVELSVDVIVESVVLGGRGKKAWSRRLGHTGTAYGGRAHLGQDLVQPLQGAVEVKLDPAGGARHSLPSTQQSMVTGCIKDVNFNCNSIQLCSSYYSDSLGLKGTLFNN